MLFNSLTFLVFFPVTVAIYFALPHKWRWAHLLVASCVFYAAYIPAYLLILLGVIVIDYVAGIGIERTSGRARRALLVGSLLANVGVLAAFKYFNFANDNVRALAQAIHWNYPVRNLGWLLPIGLSFHTFQSMSYTIEVYRGRQRAERNPGIYALYVMFFPQLVAGPIERPQNLLHQFRERHDFDPDRGFDGLRLMLWGLFKKLVVADRAASLVDVVYANPHRFGGGWLTLATVFFAFQIYCDFSGYSDVAIGAARVMGFGLMRNFDRPYAAATLADFWRRWHISLSTWFRDYVYVPLGGSRVSAARWCLNVMIVFVISGVWHGANWTYLVWGALHGVLLIAERWGTAAWGVTARGAFSRGTGTLVTFALVCLAWVFFRADSVSRASWIVAHLARRPLLGRPSDAEFLYGVTPFRAEQIGLTLAMIAAVEIVQWAAARPETVVRWAAQPAWVRWPAYYALVIAVLAVGDLGARSFIYFQF